MVGEAWANQQVIGVRLQLISLVSLGFTSLQQSAGVAALLSSL